MEKEKLEENSFARKKIKLRRLLPEIGLGISVLMTANSAFAQSIPWQTPFQNLIQWMSNDTAKWVITLVIVGAGLAFAIGETGGFFRRCSGAVLGGAIAVQAATWSGALFGW